MLHKQKEFENASQFFRFRLKVPMTDFFFIFLLHSTWGSDMITEKIFPLPIFLHRVLAVWKHEICFSGWVKNRIKRETGDSCVVKCYWEHIDNKLKRSERL